MDNFIPNKQHLRQVLFYLFNIKKWTGESNKWVVEACGEHCQIADSGLEDLKIMIST